MNSYRCHGCGASQTITLGSKVCEYCGKPIEHLLIPAVSIPRVSDEDKNLVEENAPHVANEPHVGFLEKTYFYFLKAIKSTIEFSGRASIAEYWFFVFGVFLVYVVSSLLQGMLIDSFIGDLIGMAEVLFFLLIIVTSTSLGVRRLHDVDRSGFWYLLCLIPLVGALILLLWSIQNGTVGSNTYGEQPEDI
jgi:uncharacterized membrane protein YhaH (DUF805 family)